MATARRLPTIVTGITPEEHTRVWGAIRALTGTLQGDFNVVEHAIVKARGAWWFIVRTTQESTLPWRFYAVPCQVVAVRSNQRLAKYISRTSRNGNGTPIGTAYCGSCGGSKLDGEHRDNCRRPRGWKPPRRLPRSNPHRWGWFQGAAVRKAKGLVTIESIRVARHYGAGVP